MVWIWLQNLNRPVGLFCIQFLSTDRPFTRLGLRVFRLIRRLNVMCFLCPRHSKNGGGALSVTPVRASVRASVSPCVRPKFGVRSITFERLHRLNLNLVCWCIISKHRSSSIWVTIHQFLTELWAFYINIAQKLGVRSITFQRLHWYDSYLACWYIISKNRSSSIWVTIHIFFTELWAFYKNIVQKLVSTQ